MNWRRYLTRSLLTATFIGVVVGFIMALSLEKIDQLTSTDNFCSNSCHMMADYVAYESGYINSPHRTTYTGIQAGCADCHIPKGLLAAAWTHAISGMKDTWSLLVNDFSTREAWNKQRINMAYQVRDWMLANDSTTCRACHERNALKPRRERGGRRHELAQRNNVTCIACHYNLVHEKVAPRPEFLRKAGAWPPTTE
jgi:cytochrome c-type protein NapC